MTFFHIYFPCCFACTVHIHIANTFMEASKIRHTSTDSQPPLGFLPSDCARSTREKRKKEKEIDHLIKVDKQQIPIRGIEPRAAV